MSQTSFSVVAEGEPSIRETNAETSADAPSPHVHYASSGVLSVDPSAHVDFANVQRVDSNQSAPISPLFRRRTGRAGTFKPVEEFEDYGDRAGWHRTSSCLDLALA